MADQYANLEGNTADETAQITANEEAKLDHTNKKRNIGSDLDYNDIPNVQARPESCVFDETTYEEATDATLTVTFNRDVNCTAGVVLDAVHIATGSGTETPFELVSEVAADTDEVDFVGEVPAGAGVIKVLAQVVTIPEGDSCTDAENGYAARLEITELQAYVANDDNAGIPVTEAA